VTQPSQRGALNPRPSLHDAIAAHVSAQMPDGPPAWWTPDVQANVQRYVQDEAYRQSLSGVQRELLNNRREAAIALGLISATDYLQGAA
jgi:hypothetical protein